MEVTEKSLYKGIEKALPGNRVSDISHAVQSFAESFGYSVVREFVGHGIGRALHEEPQVPNFGHPGQGPRLKAGHDAGDRADDKYGEVRHGGHERRLDRRND